MKMTKRSIPGKRVIPFKKLKPFILKYARMAYGVKSLQQLTERFELTYFSRVSVFHVYVKLKQDLHNYGV